MFATRKQLKIVNRELLHTRLIVDRLRRDLDRAQMQLRNMHGWWDDFTKTREMPDSETRIFERKLPLEELPPSTHEPVMDAGPGVASATGEHDTMPASGVHRRSA